MVLQKHHRKPDMTRREHRVLPYLADAVEEVPSDLRKKKQDASLCLSFLCLSCGQLEARQLRAQNPSQHIGKV